MMRDETIIIGGGPAGAAAAIHLARRGMPVRLLERQAGPHHKVCGEFISYEAAHHLKNLGLDLPALGAQPIRRARFYNGEQDLHFALPFTAWSLSRRTLDSALLDQAKVAGASVELGTAVRKLSRAGNGWELTTQKKLAPVTQRAVRSAKTIFLANGKHELRDWQRPLQKETEENARFTGNLFIGFKMHLFPGNLHDWQEAVEIHLFDGGYAGLEPIENGVVNLCFLIRQEIYKTCGGSWPEVLRWLADTSSHLRLRLAGLTPLWHEPLAVAGIPYGFIASPADAVPDLFRLGDQAAVIPSFAGDGIAIALHTATLAAQIHGINGDSSAYHRRAHEDLAQPLRAARLLANLLAHPQGRNIAFTVARLLPALMREKILSELIMRTRVSLPDELVAGA
ncbi:NAD(P)/FAD-dependent oxidoreductase [Cellvibrio sp. ARAG 10.3]|uniref:NAD(P)/FAD-dependent oxidoreductase n=1 Tax=Cellvibrio sp. ARAG 10.3 TaxID=3451358 RepID=UPI003F488F64